MCCRGLRLRSIGLTSSLVSIFLTVFAVGSNGGIFSTSENTLSSIGIISNPLGAFSEDFTFPVTAIEKRDELAERMKNKGMKTDAFEYHLGAFDFGVPPHAGCGIGLERLMMALTGTENIRDVTFYPRDVDRLTP